MLRGLYMAGCGMLAETVRNDVTANNLANANTTAFKKDGVALRAFPEVLIWYMREYGRPPAEPAGGAIPPGSLEGPIGSMSWGTAVDEIRTYQGAGPRQYTGRELDIALPDGCFIAVETAAGERYTREGNLQVASDGYLVLPDGSRVLGEKGPVQIGEGTPQISEKGEIIVNGEAVDRLRVVSSADPRQLTKQGNSFYALAEGAEEPQTAEDVRLQVGFLEGSNVNPVQEMAQLISLMRSYEANQKVVQAYDGTLEKLIGELGRA